MNKYFEVFKFFLLILVVSGLVAGCTAYEVSDSATDQAQNFFASGRDVTFEMESDKRYFIESDSPITLSARSENGQFVISHSDGVTFIQGDTPELNGFVARDVIIKNGVLRSGIDVTVDLEADTLIAVKAEMVVPEATRFKETFFMAWFFFFLVFGAMMVVLALLM